MEQIYKNALEIIRNIYEESKYDKTVDLYRSIDLINSLSKYQIESKKLLVEQLVPFLNVEKIHNIAILGGWYGITSILLRDYISENIHIANVDIDPMSKTLGKILISSDSKYKYNKFYTEDALDFVLERYKNIDVIINTSIEHMEQDDIKMILLKKRYDCITCFQGNNYHSVQSHINTHNSLEEFVHSFDFNRVLYSGELVTPDYSRYTVIGL